MFHLDMFGELNNAFTVWEMHKSDNEKSKINHQIEDAFHKKRTSHLEKQLCAVDDGILFLNDFK